MTIRQGRWLVLAILSVAALGGGGSGYAQNAAYAPASGGQVVVQTPGGAPQVIKVDGPLPPGVTPEMLGRKPEEKKAGEGKEGKPDEKKKKKRKKRKTKNPPW